MPIDPYIAQGGVGRDIPNVLAMIDQRRQMQRQNALVDRRAAQEDEQLAQQGRADEAKKTLAETQWALSQDDPHAAVMQLPHIAAALQKQGVDIATVPPDQLKGQLQHWQMKAASELGIGPPEQPVKYEDVPLAGGAIGQRDPRTNELKVPYRPSNEASTPIAIERGGQPVYVRPQDAIGQKPYSKPGSGDTVNPNAVQNLVDLIGTGAVPLPTGSRFANSAFGQAVVSGLKQSYPEFQGSTYPTRLAALKDFTSGTSSKTVRSLNVAIAHLGTLGQLATALNNKDTQLLNKASNSWKTQTGNSAPTNFNSAKQIVANEIVKAITSTGGALADREEAQAQISAASSPEQLAGVIQTFKDLLAGQLGGLAQTYEQGTSRKDFNRFLSKDVIAELENAQGQPVTQTDTSASDVQALLDKYK